MNKWFKRTKERRNKELNGKKGWRDGGMGESLK
jgi:hypothetical protein